MLWGRLGSVLLRTSAKFAGRRHCERRVQVGLARVKCSIINIVQLSGPGGLQTRAMALRDADLGGINSFCPIWIKNKTGTGLLEPGLARGEILCSEFPKAC